MEITSFLSNAHNWKSPGNDKIQNYWLKAFAAAHTRIRKKNFNSIMEKSEKVPDWLTTGISYLLPISGDSKEVRKYRPFMCLSNMYKTLMGKKAPKNVHTFGRVKYTDSTAKRMSPWK